ncbi:Pyrroloquinoline quinone (coenzymePQQ)biosynthesis protein C [Rickettsia prowazekii str. Rp22]|uniref:Pyrroloquinoline quinone (CoenzymePQQ)biosynthesis protein C n=1 Tax=Rickettsia prowazekii (strain Rp22) TaxID=449216 RepID=D5AVV0_RICPP|nr:Pyrroloquinoline quinone (coenzymePQQ)biosynthesis protein C [Rickettsia prowazekii str. Rp22]
MFIITPEITDSKIQVLQKFYRTPYYRTLQFFIVHSTVYQLHDTRMCKFD